jgi:hypothetical protein
MVVPVLLEVELTLWLGPGQACTARSRKERCSGVGSTTPHPLPAAQLTSRAGSAGFMCPALDRADGAPGASCTT